MSFGVAAASLVTALFIPDRFHSEPRADDPRHPPGLPRPRRPDHPLRNGIPELRSDDGSAVSQHKAILPTG